ncbi:hypothetical protein [Pedobacter sp. ASV12]|uniref:hypothetical protein n=1 Tax=Pedobacter sp. ASV12 TaxID=2795120 RepID=UPI0018ED5EE7|nr:hypothetical protein [Pedobacter sp. ASV12]
MNYQYKSCFLAGLKGMLTLVLVWCTSQAFGQTVFEKALSLKMDSLIEEKAVFRSRSSFVLPSNNLQSITTPSGWGGGNATYFFAILGAIYPSFYTVEKKPDMIGAAGISFGNSSRFVNVSASVNVTRVSELRDLSANIVLSRQIFKSCSIAVGGLQLFADPAVSDAPENTYYIAFSHAIRGNRSQETGNAALSYTIGFGTGRFLRKSPNDVAAGKGKYGTGVFANVSYEVVKRLNLNAEWSGLNLGFSLGVRPLKNSAITMGFGVFNLTNYSGDRVTYMSTIGIPIFLDRKNIQL